MSFKTYPNTFKIEVVKYYKCHHTVAETLERYGIAESTLFKWKSEYESKHFLKVGKVSSPAKKKAPLHSHVRKMEQILEVVQLCLCKMDTSTEEKVHIIDSLKEQYSVRVLCDALNLPRGTYYNRKRRENNPTVSKLNDEKLKLLIKEVFEESKGRFGRKPIKYKLLEQGYRIHESHVSRLMKEMGLKVKVPEYIKEHLKSIPKSRYQNLLNGDFSPESPNRSWATDITYVKVNDNYMFICVIIDLFSRKVLSYGISDHIDTILTLSTFDEAFIERGKPQNLIFHSDQGVQYTAYAFRSHLKNLKVRQSFSSPGVPYDNSVCESFFHTLKTEEIYHHLYVGYHCNSRFLKKRRIGACMPRSGNAEWYNALRI